MKNVSQEDFDIYKDVVDGAYRFHDMMLERLLKLAGDDTTVIIVSDQGFTAIISGRKGYRRYPPAPRSSTVTTASFA